MCGDVLIVEDDEGLATMLALHLEDAGLCAAGARTCREALFLAEARRFELVFLDYQLPDGTGLEVLQTLRSRQPEAPVVMMSATHDPGLVARARRRGACDFLMKPLSTGAVDNAIQGLMMGGPRTGSQNPP